MKVRKGILLFASSLFLLIGIWLVAFSLTDLYKQILEIPKLKAELPIIEGTEEEELEKGVGHYSSTVFPSQPDQLLLSGHRDTVFRGLGVDIKSTAPIETK